MKKIGILIFLLFGISALFGKEVPTRFFVGNTEVTETIFKEIPDSLKSFTSVFDYDTIKIQSIELPITHYIDSVSSSGKFLIKERSKEETEFFLNRIRSLNSESQNLRLKVGDLVPSFCLHNFKKDDIDVDFPQKGKCYLISFWATWCGNCLMELKQEFLPLLAKEFSHHTDFMFLPICIDVTVSELHEFFVSKVGSNWEHLVDMTYIDTDRTTNEIFATGGHLPLNVVIDRKGIVRYIHLGKISENEDLDKVRDVLSDILNNS